MLINVAQSNGGNAHGLGRPHEGKRHSLPYISRLEPESMNPFACIVLQLEFSKKLSAIPICVKDKMLNTGLPSF